MPNLQQAIHSKSTTRDVGALLAVGAGYAAVTIRNALIARLVLLPGRDYGRPIIHRSEG